MRRLLALAALVLLLGAAPAAAHEDTGTMTVTAAEQLDGLQIRLEVGILYTGDEHLAEEATVTAVLSGPDGASVGPVQLPHVTGARYGADLFLPSPGTWSARITSTGPTAEATATVEVGAAPATTSTTAPSGPDEVAEAPVEEDEDGGTSTAGWLLAGLAAAGSILAFKAGQRRRNRQP